MLVFSVQPFHCLAFNLDVLISYVDNLSAFRGKAGSGFKQHGVFGNTGLLASYCLATAQAVLV